MRVETSIGWAPGAEDNPLAKWAGQAVAEHVAQSARCRRDLLTLRAAVAMVARDRRLSATLRFDHGRLTVHDGMVGIPDVTFFGDYDLIVGLADLRRSRQRRRAARASEGRPTLAAVWRRTVLDLCSSELKVYGLATHPRIVWRLLRLLAG